eukprot:CAMPEP_0172625576 /NCGR_PEP_ID=MMETSP1068-20121228/144639_1 /TAXON_ID=35684 /ORGANISM="Pseudopedinella elastica, Strain CCMP716" /LENGTH=169 /DNA_ID=CAMNT_0013434907 /DNA_START=83 /DNA_END=588 /DNA_ORIENTATION=-
MTAGSREYAEPLLDILDPENRLQGRFYRDSCVPTDGGLLLKDLSIVDQDPRRVLLVDNNLDSFRLCPENGMPVDSFTHDPTDQKLEEVWTLLRFLEHAPDVREPLRAMFDLEGKLRNQILTSCEDQRGRFCSLSAVMWKLCGGFFTRAPRIEPATNLGNSPISESRRRL